MLGKLGLYAMLAASIPHPLSPKTTAGRPSSSACTQHQLYPVLWQSSVQPASSQLGQ